jgi:hypothetical protein
VYHIADNKYTNLGFGDSGGVDEVETRLQSGVDKLGFCGSNRGMSRQYHRRWPLFSHLR